MSEVKHTPGSDLALWKQHGGDVFGPNVEHVSMPLSSFSAFCGALIQRDRSTIAAKVAGEVMRSAHILRADELSHALAALIIEGK